MGDDSHFHNRTFIQIIPTKANSSQRTELLSGGGVDNVSAYQFLSPIVRGLLLIVTQYPNLRGNTESPESDCDILLTFLLYNLLGLLIPLTEGLKDPGPAGLV